MNLNVYIYHTMESHESHLILFQIQSNPMANNGIQALLAYHDLIGISLPSFDIVVSSFVQITYVAFLLFFLTAPLIDVILLDYKQNRLSLSKSSFLLFQNHPS
jgi:hypothetical protein